MAKKTKTDLRIPFVPECSKPGCEQLAYLLPDTSKPPRSFKEPSTRMYTNEDGTFESGGDLTMVVAHESKAHPSGLCYYHLKQALGLFDLQYPVKGRVPAMFDLPT
jgi:hypothetical protein